jgi:hypothetical protein
MTTSAVSNRDRSQPVRREPRPFLFLEPARLPLREASVDPTGQQRLEAAVLPQIPQLVRSLVDFTIARQNRRAQQRGRPQPIPMSVLNRRRRAARTWLLAIAAGQCDGATRHAVATQWLPMLCGTGPDLAEVARPGRVLVEFLRGALTACLFDAPTENLLPAARALHVLETTLATHLAALLQIQRATAK